MSVSSCGTAVAGTSADKASNCSAVLATAPRKLRVTSMLKCGLTTRCVIGSLTPLTPSGHCTSAL